MKARATYADLDGEKYHFRRRFQVYLTDDLVEPFGRFCNSEHLQEPFAAITLMKMALAASPEAALISIMGQKAYADVRTFTMTEAGKFYRHLGERLLKGDK